MVKQEGDSCRASLDDVMLRDFLLDIDEHGQSGRGKRFMDKDYRVS
jgi:hypothetical protein